MTQTTPVDFAKYGITVTFIRGARGPEDGRTPVAFLATVETPRGSFSTPWTVGVGHVERLIPKMDGMPYRYRVFTLNDAERFRQALARYTPSAHDLIVHMLAFADTLDLSFAEWAEGLGLSSDSIKARDSYQLYQDGNRILRRAIGADWGAILEYAQEQ